MKWQKLNFAILSFCVSVIEKFTKKVYNKNKHRNYKGLVNL